jgi:hypothetical protein
MKISFIYYNFILGGVNIMKKLVKKIPAKKTLVAFYMGECKNGSCQGR